MNANFQSRFWLLAVLAVAAWQATLAQAQESSTGATAAEPTPTVAVEGESSPEAIKSEAATPPATSGLLESEVVVELVQERHPNGSIKIEREMTQDANGNYVLHGAWRYYDESGRLVIDGRFVDGQREGLWRRFYRANEAALLATHPYKDFARPLISSATFQAGRMHGTWTIIDSKERVAHEIELDRGQRHGAATWYYPSGAVLIASHYEHGLPQGDMAQLAADGSMIGNETYDRGRKAFRKTEYHDESQQAKKQEATYLRAPLVEQTRDDWDLGKLATFKTEGQDQRHGPYWIWHANGQLARQGQFHLDAPVGDFVAWYPNGQKHLQGTYVDGRQEGIWTWWHANGQKAVSGEYREAKPHGKWSWWTAGGDLAKNTDFSRHRPVVSAAGADDEIRTADLPDADSAAPLK